jgi:hypothetical protein
MGTTFANHTVICGWNHRGPAVVASLRAFGRRPVVIINQDIQPVIEQVGTLPDVFAVSGDPGSHATLRNADVGAARSVVVLADYALGHLADARSVQIALAVEKIQVSVHTVVELTDIRNKVHFRWTKVDELISDEEISVTMIAQGIRHILSEREITDAAELAHEAAMLRVYQQLVKPKHDRTQIFRVNCRWDNVKSLTFDRMIAVGLGLGVLPVALAGYSEHQIAARPGQKAWTSWKIDVKTNPPPGAALESFWPQWPGSDYLLGIMLLAKSREQAEKLDQELSHNSTQDLK